MPRLFAFSRFRTGQTAVVDFLGILLAFRFRFVRQNLLTNRLVAAGVCAENIEDTRHQNRNKRKQARKDIVHVNTVAVHIVKGQNRPTGNEEGKCHEHAQRTAARIRANARLIASEHDADENRPKRREAADCKTLPSALFLHFVVGRHSKTGAVVRHTRTLHVARNEHFVMRTAVCPSHERVVRPAAKDTNDRPRQLFVRPRNRFPLQSEHH